MVTNSWGDRIKLYCLNHDEPKLMNVVTNTEFIKTPFYACEDYLRDEPCKNRLNLDDYQNIIFKLLDKVTELGPCGDLTNFGFLYKGARQKIKVKVIKYTDDEIKLGVLNMTVLGVK